MEQKLSSTYQLTGEINRTTLIRALDREKRGKKEAEKVIEKKSLELYNANKKLERLNLSLEKKVIERTQELELAMEKAEESLMVKERFLATMSHEIRTPVNAISGFTNLMLKSNLSQKHQMYMDAVKTSSENLLVIIDDILDFSKIEAGKLDVEYVDFDFREMIGTLIYSFHQRALDNGIEIAFRIDKNINKTLKSDPTRIKQIVSNLISNAIKFTKDGDVELECQLSENREGDQVVDFIVKDSGVGIREENLDRIFESFSQEDQSITRKFGGTGLGLTICRELTHLLKGKISVESQIGLGTTFTVSLPLFKSHNSIGSKFGTGKPSRNSSAFLNNKRILLVEDNDFNQMLVESILMDANVKLDIADNGKIAVEMVGQGKYDLILMDIQMPVMDGIQATKIIREELNLNIPIVALTANALREDREKYIQCGMNDYISKPFTEEELFSKMQKLTSLNSSALLDNPFTLDKVEELSRGDKFFFENLLSKLLENNENLLNEALSCIDQQNHDQCKRAVHTMKTSMNLLQAHKIKDVILAIEALKPGEQNELVELGVKLKLLSQDLFERLREEVFPLVA